ncbi:hypothetical protein BDZ94DRAFT_1319971 [Collybia nuda]|uniref:F-box domain-containing protein n=1 Tax=Collybia nuda TaxID=64659 RepID=A0A9P6CL58_9AGAR|nr:hypothetical protein BDZ94DRAFT_1319971 [Collybia nuda]
MAIQNKSEWVPYLKTMDAGKPGLTDMYKESQIFYFKSSVMDAFENHICNIAASGSLQEREDGQARLKSMTDKVESQLRRLRALHNMLTPTGRLPSEILSGIFHLLMVDECLEDHANQLSAARLIPRWIVVSQVCAHWRGVALDCSALWTRLDSRNVEYWATETLARTGNAPLRADIKVDDCTSMFEYILSASSRRIRHLSITKNEGGYFNSPSVDGCVSFIEATPILETLDIIMPPVRMANTKPIPASVVKLLETTSVLRELRLRYCTPNWNLPVLRGLTSLVVRDVSFGTRPDVDMLTFTLKDIPNLIHLELSSTLSNDGLPMLNKAPRIVLKHLKSLCIKDACVVATNNFLNQLAFPALVSLELECFLIESPLVDIGSAVPNFTEELKRMPFGPIKRLEIKQPQRDAVIFGVWEDREEGIQCGRNWTISLRIAPEGRPIRNVTPYSVHAVARMLRILDLEELERISVSGTDMVFTRGEWFEWFGHLEKLTKITMSNGCWSLLTALSYASSPPYVDGTWQLFPALRDIKLREMWTTVVYFDHYLFEVRQFLQARGNIQELEVENCLYIQKEDVERMGKFVKNVTWKGPPWEYDD